MTAAAAASKILDGSYLQLQFLQFLKEYVVLD
jgi:hypothetical protein